MNNATTKNRGSYGTVIAVILFFAMVIGNYFQYQLSPLAGQLMTGMGLTPNQFSSVFTSPMISAIILGIIAGVLVVLFMAGLLLLMNCLARRKQKKNGRYR